MSTIVYGSIVSTRTQRVILFLEELGIKYGIHPLRFEKGDHQVSFNRVALKWMSRLRNIYWQNAKDPKYVAEHHPFAKVPAFQNADVKMFESRAICRYLANRHQSELGPPIGDNKALALFEQAASVEASYFEPTVEKLAFELIFKKYVSSSVALWVVSSMLTNCSQSPWDWRDRRSYRGPTKGSVDQSARLLWEQLISSGLSFRKGLLPQGLVSVSYNACSRAYLNVTRPIPWLTCSMFRGYSSSRTVYNSLTRLSLERISKLGGTGWASERLPRHCSLKWLSIDGV